MPKSYPLPVLRSATMLGLIPRSSVGSCSARYSTAPTTPPAKFTSTYVRYSPSLLSVEKTKAQNGPASDLSVDEYHVLSDTAMEDLLSTLEQLMEEESTPENEWEVEYNVAPPALSLAHSSH